jgi:hypothetical protein
MVSLDALIDSCGMLFGAMVYHWWVIHDYVVHPNTHTYDFGLWWGLLGDTTSIFMVQNLYLLFLCATFGVKSWVRKSYGKSTIS